MMNSTLERSALLEQVDDESGVSVWFIETQ